MTTLLPPKACLWLYIYICFAIRVCASWCVCVLRRDRETKMYRWDCLLRTIIHTVQNVCGENLKKNKQSKGQNMKTALEYGASLMNLKLKQQSMNSAFTTKGVFSVMLTSRETHNLLRPKRQNKDKTAVLIPALVFFFGRKNHNVICKRFAVKSRLSFCFTLISI